MEIDLMFDSGWIVVRGSCYRLVMDQWQQRREKRGVAADGAPPDPTLAFIRASYRTVDVLRRAQGNMAAAFGLDPSECTYRVIASGPYWRLRNYGNHATSHSVLILLGLRKSQSLQQRTHPLGAVCRSGERPRFPWPASRTRSQELHRE